MIQMDKYIAKHVFWAIVVVLFVLVMLNSLFTFLAELGSLRAGYQFFQAVFYIVYSMPNMALQVLPVSVLLGCLIGLGSLASHSELVVMRVSGMSLFRISWAAVKPVLVLIIFGMLLGEYVVPALQTNADETRTIERSVKGDFSDEGFWWREGNSYIHIGNVRENRLRKVDVLVFNGHHRLQQTLHAQNAIKKGSNWQLINVTIIDYRADNMKKSYKAVQPWDVHLDSTLLKMAITPPQNLSIQSLYEYIHYMKKQQLDTRLYELAFYDKLLSPLAIISLLLIGVSFIFGPLRSVTMGYRLFAGVVVGVLFMLFQNLMGPASIVFNFPPLLAVSLPVIICFLVAYRLLKKAG